ncbi:MAG TPA: hypothetical protein VGX23_23800 [Actinocrinis sp.]|nr:hypothetical protein [Actinocrinis sp.]
MAEAEEFGALTLFVTAAKGHDFYARPTFGWSGEVTSADVERVRARQRQLGFPECFEWVVELCPSLGTAIANSDDPALTVREFPLLVLDRWPEQGPGPVSAPVSDSAARILEPVVAAVLDPVGGRAVSAGQHLPSGPTSQIMGIGTLPSERRHGHATTLTALLASDARARAVRRRRRDVAGVRLAAVGAVRVDDRLQIALRPRVADVAGEQVGPGRAGVRQVAHRVDLPDHGALVWR